MFKCSRYQNDFVPLLKCVLQPVLQSVPATMTTCVVPSFGMTYSQAPVDLSKTNFITPAVTPGPLPGVPAPRVGRLAG